MKSVITLIGPTAAGKTRLCLELSKYGTIEVISADSRQIYRGMDIGTGKPTPKEREKVPHHFIDIKDPDEMYSAYEFGKDCREKVNEIRSRGNVPIICGGTIFYIKALIDGMFPEPEIPPEIRRKVRKQIKVEPERLYKELEKIDPESARRIHRNDSQRIARAIEVYKASGITLTEYWKKENTNRLPLDLYCLLPKKEEVYKNIEKRVKKMFDNGFLEEVKNLLNKGYDPSLYSFTSIGYKEIAEFIMGKREEVYREVKDEIIRETKKYASRQITFIKGLSNVKIFKTSQTMKESLVEKISK